MKLLQATIILGVSIFISSCGFIANNSISDHARSLEKGDGEISAGFTTHLFSTIQAGIRGKYGITDFWDAGLAANYNGYISDNPNTLLRFTPTSHLSLLNKFTFTKNIALATNLGAYFQNSETPKWELDPTLLFSFYNKKGNVSFTPVLGYKYIFNSTDFNSSNYQVGFVLSIMTKKSFVIRPEISFNINSQDIQQVGIPLPLLNLGVSFGFQFKNQSKRLEEKDKEDSKYDDYVPKKDGYK